MDVCHVQQVKDIECMRICDILCRHNVPELVDELFTEAAGEVQSSTEFVVRFESRGCSAVCWALLITLDPDGVRIRGSFAMNMNILILVQRCDSRAPVVQLLCC